MEEKYIPKVTVGIIAINIIVLIVLDIIGDTNNGAFMAEHGAMYPPLCLEQNKWFVIFTAMFLHFGIDHLVNNMVMLGALGAIIEKYLGSFNYIVLYLVSGLFGNILSLMWQIYSTDYAVSAGASGCVFGIVGATLSVVIKNKGHFEGITTKGILFMCALTLVYGFTSGGINNLAHIGGFATGFLLCAFLLMFEDK